MSKIFFDHLIGIEEIKVYIDNIAESHEEKTDLWDLVDEYINNRILFSILGELDEYYHDEFMMMFLEKPYDLEIIDYLNSKLPFPFEELIQEKKYEMIKDLYSLLEIEQGSGNIENGSGKKKKRLKKRIRRK